MLCEVYAYQEGAEHVKGDEVDDGESAAAGHLFPGLVVRLRVAQFPLRAGEHDLLPRFTSGTPETQRLHQTPHTHTNTHKTIPPMLTWEKTYVILVRPLSPHKPEQQKHSLWKGLEVVVSVDVRVVHHGNLTKHLAREIHIKIGQPPNREDVSQQA